MRTNTPETRRAVYDKARNALIGQLKAIVPPLPTSEISRQRLELEEAIRRAEREADQRCSGGAAAGRQTAQSSTSAAAIAATGAAARPVVEEPARTGAGSSNSPQEVFRGRSAKPRAAPISCRRR